MIDKKNKSYKSCKSCRSRTLPKLLPWIAVPIVLRRKMREDETLVPNAWWMQAPLTCGPFG